MIGLLLLSAIFLLNASHSSVYAQIESRRVNLTYLSQRADVIEQGKITKVEHEPMPGAPNIPTVKVTISVQDMVRGPAASTTYTLREVDLNSRQKNLKRTYAAGANMFLFLTAPSKFGNSAPVAIEQGRFHIQRHPSGTYMIANECGNVGLFKDIESSAKKAGKSLTRAQSQLAATKQGPVELDGFVSLVKNLTLLPRIK